MQPKGRGNNRQIILNFAVLSLIIQTSNSIRRRQRQHRYPSCALTEGADNTADLLFVPDSYARCGRRGVCPAEDVQTMSVTGTAREREDYILCPAGEENSVQYIPTDGTTAYASMEPVLAAEALEELIVSVCGQPMLWPEDRKERTETFRTILRRCDRRELTGLVCFITARKAELSALGRRLAATDETLLRQARHLVCGELAFALGATEEEAEARLLQLMKAAEGGGGGV